jgi:Zn-dependent M28 family amino/carboxypeptidase
LIHGIRHRATDNAIGCAIMMEAARILKTLGVTAASHDSRGALER